MHADEANQAVKFGELLETGRYAFDPRDLPRRLHILAVHRRDDAGAQRTGDLNDKASHSTGAHHDDVILLGHTPDS